MRFARQLDRSNKPLTRRERRRYREQIRELNRRVDAEALQLAQRVVAGEFTRADVEQMVRETGDGEPMRALLLLDKWGIRS